MVALRDVVSSFVCGSSTFILMLLNSGLLLNLTSVQYLCVFSITPSQLLLFYPHLPSLLPLLSSSDAIRCGWALGRMQRYYRKIRICFNSLNLALHFLFQNMFQQYEGSPPPVLVDYVILWLIHHQSHDLCLIYIEERIVTFFSILLGDWILFLFFLQNLLSFKNSCESLYCGLSVSG